MIERHTLLTGLPLCQSKVTALALSEVKNVRQPLHINSRSETIEFAEIAAAL